MAGRRRIVIWRHFEAFIWLRWRLGANRNRRAGFLNTLVERFIIVCAAGAALLAFLAGLVLGIFALPRASMMSFMLIWDVIVGLFLFFWMTELLADLQRSEVLSLENFLHLPVSLSGVFLINYLGSMFSFASVTFVPLMVGLSVGVVLSKGPMMLWMFPLLATFTLMVTAITYQFRGWLASLMVNQRRRRSIIAIASISFMLIVQLPQIVNIVRFRQFGPASESTAELRRQRDELERLLAAGDITKEEYSRRAAGIARKRVDPYANIIQRSARTANLVIPLGWLPYGATASAEGQSLPPLLATIGLAVMGALSLRRSYKTTLMLYTGRFTSKAPPRAGTTVERPKEIRQTAAGHRSALLEKDLPLLSGQASVIALAGLRSLLRAPEAKMILLSPVVMIGVFGGMFLSRSNAPPAFARPLMAAGSMTFILFMLMGLAGNLFGFDRGGFRAFVLAPAPRRDILLGKNASIAPFAITLMTIPVVLVQLVYPMRPDHFAAALVQMVPMYLAYCLIGNLLSIVAPTALAAGSMRPAQPKGVKILIHLGFIVLMPVVQVLTLTPLGIEYLLHWSQWAVWFPAHFVFTLMEGVLALFIYRRALDWQGEVLQRREQRILEVVTSKPE